MKDYDDICRWCYRVPPRPGRIFCTGCNARQLVADKHRRSQRKAMGLCQDCGSPSAAGRIRCPRHLAKRRAAEQRARDQRKAREHELGIT